MSLAQEAFEILALLAKHDVTRYHQMRHQVAKGVAA